MKKEKQKDDDPDQDIIPGSQTQRENSGQDDENSAFMNKRTQATMEQLIQMNENEEDLQWQRPRSHSLPNMVYQENDDQYDSEDSQDMRTR